MTIPIFNLTRQYKDIKEEVQRALQQVLESGNFILGSEVQAFEKEFASYIGVPYAIGVASGTDALTLAIRSLRLDPTDEILMPVNAYPTYFGVAMAGNPIRFVDCYIDGNIHPRDIAKKITLNTKVLVVVHLYGNPADVISIRKVLKDMKRSDIYILEDCAQAHGATIGNKKVGSFGDVSIFSFYPSKNLGCYGDGGIVVTKNKTIADTVRRLRMYGEKNRYESSECSGVSRLDELHAAVLRVKLHHLDAWNKRRKCIAEMYVEKLCDCKDIQVLPFQSGSCHHIFVIQLRKRALLQKYLAKEGIGSAIHYPVPIHLIKCCMSLGYKKGDFPIAEALSRTILSIPMYSELEDKEIKQIISVLKRFSKFK